MRALIYSAGHVLVRTRTYATVPGGCRTRRAQSKLLDRHTAHRVPRFDWPLAPRRNGISLALEDSLVPSLHLPTNRLMDKQARWTRRATEMRHANYRPPCGLCLQTMASLRSPDHVTGVAGYRVFVTSRNLVSGVSKRSRPARTKIGSSALAGCQSIRKKDLPSLAWSTSLFASEFGGSASARRKPVLGIITMERNERHRTRFHKKQQTIPTPLDIHPMAAKPR